MPPPLRRSPLASGAEAVERVKELTGGYGVHSVLECVGLDQSVETAIEIARPGGAVGRVGVPQPEATIDPWGRPPRSRPDPGASRDSSPVTRHRGACEIVLMAALGLSASASAGQRPDALGSRTVTLGRSVE